MNNWDGMRAAAATELPPWIAFLVESGPFGGTGGPPQSLKEYDPEWGRAFWTGTVARELRSRADAVEREGTSAVDASLPDESTRKQAE